MTIKELRDSQGLVELSIKKLQTELTNKIAKYYRGIKPTITHNEYGLNVTVGLDGHYLYQLDVDGFTCEDEISEELGTKMKNDFVECYGGIEDVFKGRKETCKRIDDMMDAMEYSLIGIDLGTRDYNFMYARLPIEDKIKVNKIIGIK